MSLDDDVLAPLRLRLLGHCALMIKLESLAFACCPMNTSDTARAWEGKKDVHVDDGDMDAKFHVHQNIPQALWCRLAVFPAY